MTVRDLKRGARFRSGAVTYVLHRVTECSALVHVESRPQRMDADDETAGSAGPSRRYHIAPASEVDELFGYTEIEEPVLRKKRE